MGKIANVQQVPIAELHPYKRNAKIHSREQVEKIAASIGEFGFLAPVLVDEKKNILAGHGRVQAAELLNMDTVPCVFIEGLTPEQARAYILADNRLGELADWDMDTVFQELNDLMAGGFDVEITGFEIPESRDWFSERKRDDTSRQEGNDEYNAFLDKFEQPKTTDDCYTPDVVYEAVAQHVAEKYKRDRKTFVRPFYPGGDYQHENYPKGCTVVDNPPFSILAEIRDYYNENGIKYFLFAPQVSCLRNGDCAIAVGCNIVYENGADVHTAFVTNMEPEYSMISDPDLREKVQRAAEEYSKSLHKSIPKYDYPHDVATSSMFARYSKYGQTLKIRRESCILISALDEQKEAGAAIYGKGLLLSEKAAAEKAAAEKAAAEKAAATVWKLSEREKELQKGLK